MAVYRTFGIGLGFRFDHMKPLREGQSPSMRRLHSRAAKSAIRRANELKTLDVAGQPCSESAAEIQKLAHRLTELVPPVFDFEDDDDLPPKIDQLLREDFVKTSSNEFTLQRPQIDSIQDLLRMDNAAEQTETTTEIGNDELDAWNRQYGSDGIGKCDGSGTCLA